MEKIDFSKLLGFDCVAQELAYGLDFQDPTVDAKLGAKVGFEPKEPESK